MLYSSDIPAQIPVPVRDLQWAISSPSLLEQPSLPDLFKHPETTDLLRQLRSNPAPLLEYLADRKTTALGSYFEHLIIFWLSNLPSVSLIASNIQVFRDKQTMGEIDVLFEQSGITFHWELAVKFYLNIDSGMKASHFVGPRLKDTLDAKLQRIFNHQIPLLDAPESKKILTELGIKEVVSSALVKGILFQPIPSRSTLDNHFPPKISATCRTGSWVTLGRLDKIENHEFTHFLISKKNQWFTDFYYPQEVIPGNINSLKKCAAEQINIHPAPIMACLFGAKDRGVFSSDTRIFIVPDEWPALAAKFHHR